MNDRLVKMAAAAGLALFGVGFFFVGAKYGETRGRGLERVYLQYSQSPVAEADQFGDRFLRRCVDFLKPNEIEDTGQLVHALLAFSQLKDREGFHDIKFSQFLDKLLSSKANRVPRFGVTRHGIKFYDVEHRGKDGESHPYQALAVLAELGIPKEHPVRIGGERYEVADLLSDCEAMFDTNGEFEWAAISLLLYSPNRSVITNRFGKEYTLDDIADRLLRRSPGLGPCSGCHVIDALLVLQRITEAGNPSLSKKYQARIKQYFELLETFLPTIQVKDGSIDPNWGRIWADSSAYKEWRRTFEPDFSWEKYPYPPDTRSLDWKVIVTTHHLKWMMLRGDQRVLKSLRINDANYFLRHSVMTLMANSESSTRNKRIRPSYCPMSHGLHLLSLLNRDRKDAGSITSRKEANPLRRSPR